MTNAERVLYHQVHPLKLATDIGATLIAVPLLWQHQLVAGLLMAFVPPIVASAILMRVLDLEPIARSPLGAYLRRYMGPPVQAIRLVGGIGALAGAYLQQPIVIIASLALVVLAWANGLLPDRGRPADRTGPR